MRLAVAMAALTAVAFGGCSLVAVPVPTATATLHWATVDLPRGSYCWSSGGHGECADSAGPDALLKSGYLKPYRTAGGFDARINFKAKSPSHGFNAQLLTSPVGGTPVRSSAAEGTVSIPAITPGAAGLYVYLITGKWDEGDVGFFLALDLMPGVA